MVLAALLVVVGAGLVAMPESVKKNIGRVRRNDHLLSLSLEHIKSCTYKVISDPLSNTYINLLQLSLKIMILLT